MHYLKDFTNRYKFVPSWEEELLQVFYCIGDKDIVVHKTRRMLAVSEIVIFHDKFGENKKWLNFQKWNIYKNSLHLKVRSRLFGHCFVFHHNVHRFSMFGNSFVTQHYSCDCILTEAKSYSINTIF